jgi:hypothetical protein
MGLVISVSHYTGYCIERSEDYDSITFTRIREGFLIRGSGAWEALNTSISSVLS